MYHNYFILFTFAILTWDLSNAVFSVLGNNREGTVHQKTRDLINTKLEQVLRTPTPNPSDPFNFMAATYDKKIEVCRTIYREYKQRIITTGGSVITKYVVFYHDPHRMANFPLELREQTLFRCGNAETYPALYVGNSRDNEGLNSILVYYQHHASEPVTLYGYTVDVFDNEFSGYGTVTYPLN